MNIRISPENRAYLNVGCGDVYFPEWTNIDLQPARFVQAHDLRQPLPFPDNSFDAVYSSHVLEHLTPEDARKLLREQQRVLKPGGICRVVVPDLESICSLYLECLRAADDDPTERSILRYRWMVLELIDQMVREKSGGRMRDTLQRREYDAEFTRGRIGDKFATYASEAKSGKSAHPIRVFWRKVRKSIKAVFKQDDARKAGEVHRWMYDRLSLRLVLEELGFVDFSVKPFDRSAITHWEKYNLDRSRFGNQPRKPDSLFVECRKAA